MNIQNLMQEHDRLTKQVKALQHKLDAKDRVIEMLNDYINEDTTSVTTTVKGETA